MDPWNSPAGGRSGTTAPGVPGCSFFQRPQVVCTEVSRRRGVPVRGPVAAWPRSCDHRLSVSRSYISTLRL